MRRFPTPMAATMRVGVVIHQFEAAYPRRLALYTLSNADYLEMRARSLLVDYRRHRRRTPTAHYRVSKSYRSRDMLGVAISRARATSRRSTAGGWSYARRF